MPPSILKYFDIARLVGAGIKCPACEGTYCRPSRWHSKHEKLGADGYRPYRCEDCTNRFLAAKRAALERTLINAAAGVLLEASALTAAACDSVGDNPHVADLSCNTKAAAIQLAVVHDATTDTCADGDEQEVVGVLTGAEGELPPSRSVGVILNDDWKIDECGSWLKSIETFG